jgi:hypothetical protein
MKITRRGKTITYKFDNQREAAGVLRSFGFTKLPDKLERDAAEHCMEQTETGVPLPQTSTSDTTCPSCSGYGHYLVGDRDEICPECEGTGHV